MKNTLQEVTIDDTVNEPFTILTNDFNLSAEELGEIYCYIGEWSCSSSGASNMHKLNTFTAQAKTQSSIKSF